MHLESHHRLRKASKRCVRGYLLWTRSTHPKQGRASWSCNSLQMCR